VLVHAWKYKVFYKVGQRMAQRENPPEKLNYRF